MLDNKVIVLGTNGGHGENHPTEDEGKYCEINNFYGNKFQEYVLESWHSETSLKTIQTH
jgi:hypothetical protein